MVTFYLGEPAKKRKELKSLKDGVYLDNDEVITSFLKKSKRQFVLGKIPFGDFTVLEYLSYAKSLINRAPLRLSEAKILIDKTGLKINPDKRLKRLDAVSLKAVKLAALITQDTQKLQLNFDGLRYTLRRKIRLLKMLDALNDCEIAASVSDIRFVPKNASVMWFDE